MLEFVLQKIKSKKWMVLSLLIGNILLTAIAAGSPMYSHAVLQRMLTRNLTQYMTDSGKYAGLTIFRQSFQTTANRQASLDQMEKFADISENLSTRLGVAEKGKTVYYSTSFRCVPEINDGREEVSLSLSSFEGFFDHVTLTEGSFPSSSVGEDGIMEVLVSENALISHNLLVGETLRATVIKDEDGEYRTFRISGAYRRTDENDDYWIMAGNISDSACIIDPSLLTGQIIQLSNPVVNFTATWYNVLDYTDIRADEAQRIYQEIQRYRQDASKVTSSSISCYFESVLLNYLPEAKKLNTTLWVLQTPVFVLLAVFIFMVSRQMVEMEENEIAVMKSRGASRRQIIRLYLIQGGLTAAVSLLVGIPLGIFICQVLGACNAFLEFVQRSALVVEVTLTAVLFALGSALLSVVTMLLPVIRHSTVTIVDHKRGKNGRKKAPFWQKAFLDLLLLAVSLYGFYSFNSQKELLVQKVLAGESLDPFLYLCSSVFIIGMGLLFLRLFPMLIHFIFALGRKWWKPSIYVSFLRMMRTRENQGFLMIFLVMTAALGIFSAQTARTINANGEDEIQYTAGADVVLMEEWRDNSEQVASDPTGSIQLSYIEPDYGKYAKMEGVESMTRVFSSHRGVVSVSGTAAEGGRNRSRNLTGITVLGIDTKEFGETAWFKDSLLLEHWYHYLNAMSQDPNGILVSRSFQENYGYQLGDVITYRAEGDYSAMGTICGFVDYWPSFLPYTAFFDEDNNYTETPNYLIVANLDLLQSEWGVIPYQIWIKLTGSSQVVYDFASETGTTFSYFKDAKAERIKMKNDPIFQGTNGVLTVGFIVVLTLCTVGFLIYWILSIRSRSLQFGIFRAMGMRMTEVLYMLVNEQVFISLLSIAAGIGIGALASRLYVPLIQIAYSSSSQIIPLEIVSEGGDFARILVVLGVVMVVCLGILGVLISKIKISQALKLGED